MRAHEHRDANCRSAAHVTRSRAHTHRDNRHGAGRILRGTSLCSIQHGTETPVEGAGVTGHAHTALAAGGMGRPIARSMEGPAAGAGQKKTAGPRADQPAAAIPPRLPAA